MAALHDAVQVANLADWRTRMYPLEEQHLSSIERAKTCEVSLIQQCFTDRAIGLSRDPPDSLVGVPVRSQQVRAEMPYDGVLSRCRNELEHWKPISDYIMIIGSEYRSDFKGRSPTPAPSARIDLPDAIHPEVSVQRERIAEPEQLMFASRGHFAYGDAGEIGRCQGRHPKFRPRQLATSEHLVQPLACPPDGVSLRHGLIVPCDLRAWITPKPISAPRPGATMLTRPRWSMRRRHPRRISRSIRLTYVIIRYPQKAVLPSHAKRFDP
jgi:hypothetical protein